MSSRLIDVSHEIEAGMITYPGLPAPVVSDYLSREASRGGYAEGTTLQIGRIEMIANTGTYVDAPFHRFEGGIDLSGLPLERLADVEGLLIDATGRDGRAIDEGYFQGLDLRDRAVLIRTGWGADWRGGLYDGAVSCVIGRAARWVVGAAGWWSRPGRRWSELIR